MTKFYTCNRCKSTISPEVVFHLKVSNSFKAPYEASLCPRCLKALKEFVDGGNKNG